MVMVEQNRSYVYDKGKFIATARSLGGRSVGVCVPDAIRREYGIRPGVKVIVKVRVVVEGEDEEGFRWTAPGPDA